MKILLVTEKCSRSTTERDGGARVVETLQKAFGSSLSIMQFGPEAETSATWHFDYPSNKKNRFERRLDNGRFIAEKIKAVELEFTHVVFIHISMQFGIVDLPLHQDLQIWTFPMFLTPSYQGSGENVPEQYFEAERQALAVSKSILTPSHLEKQQLVEIYSVPENRIYVVPRGIQTQLMEPRVRTLNGPPQFCSVGSIKPQKNTLGLIRLFEKARCIFPGAQLKIIGPVQNDGYFSMIQSEVQSLKLLEDVEFCGYIPPSQLSQAVKTAHLHLSASTYETFGRSIFETLALGLPNIARKSGNAAAEFLEHLPYARFTDDESKTLEAIEEMLVHLTPLSSLALEIGDLFDDKILSRLIVSKFHCNDLIAISDFDGTLFHKDDPKRTERCFNAFQKFPRKVICTARPLPDLQDQLRHYGLEVDWMIGSSGSIIADGQGKPLWIKPLDLKTVSHLESQIPVSRRIEFEGHVLQLAMPAACIPAILGLRHEIYQDTAFIAHWGASKLRAVHRLLRYIDWHGEVRTFGDGRYDHELLTYFDGTWITPTPMNQSQKMEIEYV